MKIYKPLWEEGILLSPQHFQQQDRHTDFLFSSIIKMSGIFRYGAINYWFDPKALELGKLKLDSVHICLPDGTIIDTRTEGNMTIARDLTGIPNDKMHFIVSLALPIWHQNSSNLVSSSDDAHAPRRFTKTFAQVGDIFSAEETELAIKQHNLQLRFDFEENDSYILCPIAKIIRNENDRFIFEQHYVPPLLVMTGSSWLLSYLDRVTTLLLSRINSLSARRRARGQNAVDFSVSDSTLFWFLHGLNSIYPELAHLAKYPECHPEELYKLLSRLLGMLYTFRMDESVTDIEAYNHLDLYGVFDRLESKIRCLLDDVIPSPVIEINLDHFKATQWKGQIFDDRITDRTEFYLSAHSDSMSFIELQKQLPLVSKIGAPDDVERVINTAVLGIPLLPLNQIPPGLPFRMDNVYFKLDNHHPAFKRMMSAQTCSIYVPASISNLYLSLYVIMDI